MKKLKDFGLENPLNETKKYDYNGNLVYYKDSNGHETWKDYDNNGNLIHYKNSNGYEEWYKYDKNGNKIHHKDSDGYEWWKIEEGKLELKGGQYYLEGKLCKNV